MFFFLQFSNALISQLLRPSDFHFLLLCHQVIASLSKLHPKDVEAPSEGVEDMTRLSYLHEPAVLDNLATRYELNEIYVRIFHFWLHTIIFSSWSVVKNYSLMQ